MDIKTNERLDGVNDRLKLIQKTDGLNFGTDALLLAGYISGHFSYGAELGGGSGIISMLLLAREKVDRILAVEVQAEYAELISRNAEVNSLSERLTALCEDIRNLKTTEDCDVVFTNPPYMKSVSGAHNSTDSKTAARHEIFGGIEDFLNAGKRLLKFGGSFYAVYRPDRLTDIIYASRLAGLEPKRITMVHADTESEASMMLMEAKRGGRSGMQLTKPLIIYRDTSHKEYTDDMNYIMENGSFPKKFKR